MKILVLMPLDERLVYQAAAIFAHLPKTVQDKTLIMPMLMDYAMQTEVSPTWMHAVFFGMIAARESYKLAEKDGDDILIFGNTTKNHTFDLIFNFQDADFDAPYEDKTIERYRQTIQEGNEAAGLEKEMLLKYLTNLYEAQDSSMPLHDIKATADFLGELMMSDPHLERFNNEKKAIIDELYRLFKKGSSVSGNKYKFNLEDKKDDGYTA